MAEKSWYHKTCFRCKECNKLLTLDTYKSHEGVIYCVTHHRDLFKPKTVVRDVIGEIQQRKEMMAGDSSADTLGQAPGVITHWVYLSCSIKMYLLPGR